MIKRILKKWLPKPHEIQHAACFQHIKKYVSNPILWHSNRRSIAKGVALGLLIAFLPFPGQMLFAALLAIGFRANLPIAVLMTWITNPFTFLPINFFIFKIGQWVSQDTQAPFQLREFLWKGTGGWNEIVANFTGGMQSLGKPFLIGLPIVAITTSLLGYFGVHLLWKILIYFQWQQRKKKHTRRLL